MVSRRALLSALSGLLLLASATQLQAQDGLDPENTLVLELESGRVVIKMLPELAPHHVERIRTLARSGFYDGVVFHRVIPGFMAQTGDPTGTGSGGSDLPDLKAEFSNVPFERGIVGMARKGEPDTANSQWFIMFGSAPNLDRNYTVWGRVVEGMEHVDAIKAGSRSNNGAVSDPDSIVSLKLLADSQN